MSALKFEGSTVEKQRDRELVEAAVDGDKAAYGRLYDRYAPLVRAVCYDHTKNLADAQDLAQDVFVRAYERLSQLRKPERFGPWVVTAARLRCREWRRQKVRERHKHAEAEKIACIRTQPGADDRPEMLRKMISTLPEKERLALHVFYLQDNSTNDSCRIVGLSRSGFYRALDRARKQLRKRLDRELEDT